MAITILIADDHAVMRDGLRFFLEAQEDLAVIGDVGNGVEVVDLVRHLHPDIVLMDQGMRGINGSSLVPGVRQALPSTVVIANTGGSADELHAAGAVGSANKGEKMLQAMRKVAWHFRG